ncbi:MutS2 protein [uncultured Roseburia sp.]|uniref:Endonuclease MutS2 n=1 Tax=Brotonthovivens ammoniilytica TaxID=2981725 RepID=A0ABT2TJ67_9FIRM|nr:endonuclease MutS2 [Brotonthovivens ammoniilytica]MCU6762259.1 endonuclease MutS2 [Brotonthovivens ammoniilytica]SCI60458.1 MutS2 protein [uncultured Roseburia sp.]
MNPKSLKILEFDKIIQQLAQQATSVSGRELCLQLKPLTDIHAIRTAQKETKDALSRIYQKGSLSFSGLFNPEASMKRLEIGAALSITELLSICRLLETAKRAKSYSREVRTDLPPDSLNQRFSAIEPLTPLLEEIRHCIVDEDEISDDASPALHNIRRMIRNINTKIHNAMNSLLNSSSTRTYLQEAVITMRNDRYCLPVKAEYKNQVPGMIHDQSSTGSTLFIEPMSVVKLNNELKEQFLKEKEEIDIILANLSNLTADYIPYIRDNYRILTELDFIFAKAQLARIHNGMAPEFNTRGLIKIRQGRHPLLDKHKVVPIDVRLGDEFHLLIVTGPNTGGKTVSLKTVGLFTLMGQSGLHIPAGDRSELAVFREVYADIGDEQSIEQSLSTFSSHMTNIVSILEHAGSDSLVLFDELCAGTDPTEGAALAISILDTLRQKQIRTMATTHYSEIKIYALSTDGVENACCEFNVDTLSPTYRLLIGIPGKSNAFAISSKLGLSSDIIQQAREQIDKEEASFEDIISDLEESRLTIEQERREINRYKNEAQQLKKRLEARQQKLDSSRDKILLKANEEAAAILQDAKNVADETIRNFHKYGKGIVDIQAMEKEREKVRQKMDKARKKSAGKKENVVNTNIPKKLRLGDSVKVLSMNLKGTVHTLPDAKGNLFVQMGILRSQVNIKDLILLEEENPLKSAHPKTGTGKLKMSKSASISPEINLIGKTVDEAISILDKYLDDAYLAHLHTVRIVHGKGTGALRKAVHNHLKRQKIIKDFHLGEFGEGDAGVTIAEFQ